MLKYRVLFPVFLYCRPSNAIRASLSELTEATETDAKNGRDCTKLTLRRSGERNRDDNLGNHRLSQLANKLIYLTLRRGRAVQKFVMKYQPDDSKNTFLSSWLFSDHTNGEPCTTVSDLVSFTIAKPPVDESQFTTELPHKALLSSTGSPPSDMSFARQESLGSKLNLRCCTEGRSERFVTGRKWAYTVLYAFTCVERSLRRLVLATRYGTAKRIVLASGQDRHAAAT